MSSFITIKKPYKQKSVVSKGITTEVFAVRLRKDEVAIIEKACKKLDTKFSTFIKYCAIESAKEINNEF